MTQLMESGKDKRTEENINSKEKIAWANIGQRATAVQQRTQTEYDRTDATSLQKRSKYPHQRSGYPCRQPDDARRVRRRYRQAALRRTRR